MTVSFRLLQAVGLLYYFPQNLRCNLTYYESENFSDSSLHHIFVPQNNFRFPFIYEKYPNLGSEMWKIKFTWENRREFITEKCTWMEQSSRNFSCPQIKENSRQTYLLFRTENRRWVPLPCVDTTFTVLFLSFFLFALINHHHNVLLITVLE